MQPVFDLHNQVVELDTQIKAREAEVAEISKDQDRLRENMKALKGTPEEKALLLRYTGELNAQEDRLAALNKEIAQLQLDRTAANKAYEDKLDAISLEDTL